MLRTMQPQWGKVMLIWPIDFLPVSVTDAVPSHWPQHILVPWDLLSLDHQEVVCLFFPLGPENSATAVGVTSVVDESALEMVTWLLPGPLSGPVPWGPRATVLCGVWTWLHGSNCPDTSGS